MHPVDARDLLKQTLRDQIAPDLRAMGFKGSGQAFRIPNETGDHALLGFQFAKWNHTELARFTANVSFYGAGEWDSARAREPWLGLAPTPNSNYQVGWEERIGFLLQPYPHDHWWAITGDLEEARLVARDVVAVVRADLLPQLQARLRRTRPPATPQPVVRITSECPWPHCDDTEDPL
jgi:hypothetical protein